ncbi:hypothetical protein KFE98_15425 [bacterium SCSIO 12741]|nr:hypothetical protein KFE98_15425 [bacterium SCSIO 12741]
MIKRDRLKLIEEMLSTNSDDPFLNYAAALEYHKFGARDKAVEILKGIVQNHETYLGAYYRLGKLLEEDNELEEAIKVYRKGREIALQQNNQKTLGELTEALMLIDDEFDGGW